MRAALALLITGGVALVAGFLGFQAGVASNIGAASARISSAPPTDWSSAPQPPPRQSRPNDDRLRLPPPTGGPANITIPPLNFVNPSELPDYAPPFTAGNVLPAVAVILMGAAAKDGDKTGL